MNREHLHLVVSGGEPVEPIAASIIPLRAEVSVRPAPRLACVDCGGRVMAAWSGGYVVILTDHRCPPRRAGPVTRAWRWLDERSDAFVLAWALAAVALGALVGILGGGR